MAFNKKSCLRPHVEGYYCTVRHRLKYPNVCVTSMPFTTLQSDMVSYVRIRMLITGCAADDYLAVA